LILNKLQKNFKRICIRSLIFLPFCFFFSFALGAATARVDLLVFLELIFIHNTLFGRNIPSGPGKKLITDA